MKTAGVSVGPIMQDSIPGSIFGGDGGGLEQVLLASFGSFYGEAKGICTEDWSTLRVGAVFSDAHQYKSFVTQLTLFLATYEQNLRGAFQAMLAAIKVCSGT